MISVVVPLYNKGDTIARALNSILNQTFQDFEIIVVDDGSTDPGAAMVKTFKDPRIRLLQQANGGVSAARNTGIAAAKSDVVALLDADDEWKPGFLEAVGNLRHDFSEACVWATNYEFMRSDDFAIRTRIRGLPAWPWRGVLPDYFAVAAKSDPPLHSSALCISREALTAVGGFPVGIRSGEDLLTWARLAVRRPMAYDSRSFTRFYFPEALGSRLPRHDAGPDGLVDGLAELEVSVPEKSRQAFRLYRALVHTMRAEIFLQQGPRRLALAHCRKAVGLRGWSPKLAAFFLLSLLPHQVVAVVLPTLRAMRSKSGAPSGKAT